MKLAAAITMAVLVVACAQGKSGVVPETDREVTIFYNAPPVVPNDVSERAQRQAADMFAAIGVTLHWRGGTPPKSQSDAIVIEVATDTPAAAFPGSLAYAFPYEGIHIRILWDRIVPDRISRDPAISAVLAHVMVHEITHILQGVPRHSGEGIMKAHWTSRDRETMKSRPMTFTSEDVDLIFVGMDNRASHVAAPAALAATTASVEGMGRQR